MKKRMSILLAVVLIMLSLSQCYFADETESVSIGENVLSNDFSGLNDSDLLQYVEEDLYTKISDQLEEDYYVENVSAVYVSKEYLEELAYNSRSNIFFGYTLD